MTTVLDRNIRRRMHGQGCSPQGVEEQTSWSMWHRLISSQQTRQQREQDRS